MELNRKLIKSQARELIKDNWFILFLIIFVVGLLSGGISGIITNIQQFVNGVQSGAFTGDISETPEIPDVSYGFSFGGFFVFVFAPLAVTLSGMLINFVKGTRYTLGEEFTFVFKGTFNETFLQKFLLKLLTTIFTFLWSLLLIVPGIVYRYRIYFADYIMAEHPELSWRECIEASKKLTSGHKGELFVFDLSFILWYMLIGVTCGIASIYVLPYITVSQTLYYENFKQRGYTLGEISDADFLSEREKMAQAYAANGGQPPVAVPPQYQAPVQPQYQAPVQPQYQAPVQPQYQAPAEPQYQPPFPPAESGETAVLSDSAAPFESEGTAVLSDSAASAQEEFYTPPADAQQYFTPLDSDDKPNE